MRELDRVLVKQISSDNQAVIVTKFAVHFLNICFHNYYIACTLFVKKIDMLVFILYDK